MIILSSKLVSRVRHALFQGVSISISTIYGAPSKVWRHSEMTNTSSPSIPNSPNVDHQVLKNRPCRSSFPELCDEPLNYLTLFKFTISVGKIELQPCSPSNPEAQVLNFSSFFQSRTYFCNWFTGISDCFGPVNLTGQSPSSDCSLFSVSLFSRYLKMTQKTKLSFPNVKFASRPTTLIDVQWSTRQTGRSIAITAKALKKIKSSELFLKNETRSCLEKVHKLTKYHSLPYWEVQKNQGQCWGPVCAVPQKWILNGLREGRELIIFGVKSIQYRTWFIGASFKWRERLR
jgi:hypothetical protein